MQHDLATARVGELEHGVTYETECVVSGPLCGPALGMRFRHELKEHVQELVSKLALSGDVQTRQAWNVVGNYSESEWAELIGEASSLGEAFALTLERHRDLYRGFRSGPEVGPVLSMKYRHAVVEYARQQMGEHASYGWSRVAEWPTHRWAELFAMREPTSEQEAFARAGYAAGGLDAMFGLGKPAERG